jgi:hypothetical protein
LYKNEGIMVLFDTRGEEWCVINETVADIQCAVITTI